MPSTVGVRVAGEAGKPDTYVPLDRLALSPQCGFASGEAGNPVTPAQQEAKLRLVSQVARKVWTA